MTEYRISYDMMKISLLEKRFPELKGRVDVVKSRWGEDMIPPHCLFGDVFDPYLVSLLKENMEKEQIRKIFEFFHTYYFI